MEKLQRASLAELMSFDQSISAILERIFAENLSEDIKGNNLFSIIFLQQIIQREIEDKIPANILEYGFDKEE